MDPRRADSIAWQVIRVAGIALVVGEQAHERALAAGGPTPRGLRMEAAE